MLNRICTAFVFSVFVSRILGITKACIYLCSLYRNFIYTLVFLINLRIRVPNIKNTNTEKIQFNINKQFSTLKTGSRFPPGSKKFSEYVYYVYICI